MNRRPPDAGGLGAHPLTSRVVPAGAWNEVEPAWSAVFAASAARSFFLSPEWVGAWLETYGTALHAEVALFEDGGSPVGAAVLASRVTRLGFVPLRRLYFHTAGEPDADSAAVEHVAPLCRPERSGAVLLALGALVRARTWDELVLSGISEAGLEQLSHAVPGLAVETEWRPTYLVDLARLRSSGARYDSVLSRNTRDQLKRSLKLYRARGEPALRFAATPDEALALPAELGALHQARWEARGGSGAFASAHWRAFHERLIARAFPRGGVQLARVSVGDATVGLLYNFVQDGTVAFYQSGFRYEEDNRLKPGLVTHALVIQECIDQGLDVYDFLAGDPAGSRYKESLSTGTVNVAWSVIRRPTMRSRVVAALRRIKRRLPGRKP